MTPSLSPSLLSRGCNGCDGGTCNDPPLDTCGEPVRCDDWSGFLRSADIALGYDPDGPGGALGDVSADDGAQLRAVDDLTDERRQAREAAACRRYPAPFEFIPEAERVPYGPILRWRGGAR